MYFQGNYVYYATLSPLPPLPTISGYYYVSLSVSLILLIPPLSPLPLSINVYLPLVSISLVLILHLPLSPFLHVPSLPFLEIN